MYWKYRYGCTKNQVVKLFRAHYCREIHAYEEYFMNKQEKLQTSRKNYKTSLKR